MKKLYEEQKHSTYEIQKEIGSSHYFLYRYAKNTKKIKKMPYDILVQIAEFEKINPDELKDKMLKYAEKS